MIKYIKYKEKFSDTFEKYYKIKDNDLVNLDIDIDGNLFKKEDGFTEGFMCNHKWISKNNSAIWEEVIIERIDVKENFYGYGLDKVIASINGEERELIESRWEGQTNCYIPANSFNLSEECC
mgnify:CR=1 FL=1